ncbi:WD repeat-containing protein 55 [Sigmodon hispidus]
MRICCALAPLIIRAVNILSNRVVGTVSQPAGEPVEELTLSHCGQFLVSNDHDQQLKVWSMTQLQTVVVNDYQQSKKKGGSLRALSSKAWSTDDFFAGLREDGEEAKAPEEVNSDDDID